MPKKLTVKDYNDLKAKTDELTKRTEKAEKIAQDAEEKAAALATGGYSGGQPRGVGADEQKALAYFGCASAKDLLNVDTGAQKFNWVDPQLKRMVIQFKHDFQTARAIAQIFHDGVYDHIGATEKQDRFARVPSMTETYFFKNVLAPKLKAFGTGVSGGGAEWIPTMLASSYISEFEMERQLVGALKQINMPSSPYEIPTNKFTTARKGTEGVTATESSFNTDKLTFQAKKFLEYYIFPEELNEDSAPDIIALGRSELSEAHERAFETAIINGVQSPTVHLDSDTQAGAADLAEKQWTGLRKKAIVNSANGATVDFLNAAVGDVKLRQMRQRLGKLGVKPTDLLWLPGSVSYLQMLGTDNVVTVDKMGAMATVVKGMLGAYEGIPIMQTGFMREDLNATGVYDGITVDRTGILLIHKNRWYFATRRPIRLAIRPSKSADDRIEMASYSRTDFVGHVQSTRAVELGVVYGLNIAI